MLDAPWTIVSQRSSTAEGLVGLEVRSQHLATSSSHTMHKQPSSRKSIAAAEVICHFDTEYEAVLHAQVTEKRSWLSL